MCVINQKNRGFAGLCETSLTLGMRSIELTIQAKSQTNLRLPSDKVVARGVEC